MKTVILFSARGGVNISCSECHEFEIKYVCMYIYQSLIPPKVKILSHSIESVT